VAARAIHTLGFPRNSTKKRTEPCGSTS
jgi:hypothetical protein